MGFLDRVKQSCQDVCKTSRHVSIDDKGMHNAFDNSFILILQYSSGLSLSSDLSRLDLGEFLQIVLFIFKDFKEQSRDSQAVQTLVSENAFDAGKAQSSSSLNLDLPNEACGCI